MRPAKESEMEHEGVKRVGAGEKRDRGSLTFVSPGH